MEQDRTGTDCTKRLGIGLMDGVDDFAGRKTNFEVECVCLGQANQPGKVDRDGYEGPVGDSSLVYNGGNGVTPVKGPNVAPHLYQSQENFYTPPNQEFHTRGPTRSGGRNLQDSSFSLSGAQIDDSLGQRSGIRVHNPPGGRSSGIW